MEKKLGSTITADGDYSHKIKKRLLLGRKVMTNLDSIWKNKDITWPTMVHRVKAMVFPVVMNGCESWTINKVECWSTDAFKLWCWRRLESPMDGKEIKPVNPKGNQLWIFIERTDAEVLHTLATSCKEPTHWKKTLMLGKTEGGRRRGRQRMGWSDDITDSMAANLSKLHGVTKSWTWLSNWITTLDWMFISTPSTPL